MSVIGGSRVGENRRQLVGALLAAPSGGRDARPIPHRLRFISRRLNGRLLVSAILVAIVCTTIIGCASIPEAPAYVRRARRFSSIASRSHAGGEMEKALLYYKRALAIYRGTDSREGTLDCLQSVAVVYRELGNLDQAAECAAEALSLARELGAARREVDALGTLGTIWYARGDPVQAARHYNEAVELARKVRYERAIADQRNNLGLLSKQRGEYDDAMHHYTVAAGIYEKLGDKRGRAACLNNMGALLKAREQYEEALEKYNLALALDKEAGNVEGIAVCLNSLGTLHLKLGQPGKAAVYFRRAYYVNTWIGRRERAAQDLEEAKKARAIPE